MNQNRNNVTPLRPTRAQLLAFIARGWETYEHLRNPVWNTSSYYDGPCACAVGAGAAGADVGVSTFERWLHEADLDSMKVLELSDKADSREEALRSIEGYVAYIDGWMAKSHDLPLALCPYDGFDLQQLEFHAQWHCGYIDCIKALADVQRRNR